MEEFLNAFKDTLDRDVPTALEILWAMGLSLALNLMIGYVYKYTYRGTRYSQDFVQALVIVGTVTTILIMVVDGNAGIAFGMFAAFSVIRFRRNLSQARDLGFVLLAMSVGMVVGARLYSMAALAALVVCMAIIFLTRLDAFAPRRASHQLRIRVTHDIDFETVFAPIFSEFTEGIELRSVQTVQAGMMTEVRYGLVLKEEDRLQEMMSALQQVNGNNRIIINSRRRSLNA